MKRAILALMVAALSISAVHAQSLSSEPYQITGGWARVVFKGTKEGYRQDGPMLFQRPNADCIGEAVKIQEAMMMRNRPPGCKAMNCTPRYFVTCTRFIKGANGRIVQSEVR